MKQLGKIVLLLLALSVIFIGGGALITASAQSSSVLAGLAANVTDVSVPSVVAVGTPATITVETDASATCVKLTNSQGAVIGEKTAASSQEGSKLLWKFDVLEKAEGSKTYTAQAGTGYAYTSQKKVSVTFAKKPEVSGLKILNLALYCDVSGCASQDDAILEVSDSQGKVLYADYQKQKLPAGSYTVRAKVRAEENGLWSDPVGITVTEDNVILSQAIDLIVGNEGGYASVSKNDNGAMSIGRLQWHATRAHDLLNRMKSADAALAQQKLSGTTIYAELAQPNTNWKNRTASSTEASKISDLISTEMGKYIQDDQAETDVSLYISSATYRGFTTPGAIIYYADLYNQGPAYAIDIAKRMKEQGMAMTLDNLHKASLADPVMGKYPSRRNATYNKVKALGYN